MQSIPDPVEMPIHPQWALLTEVILKIDAVLQTTWKVFNSWMSYDIKDYFMETYLP